jgi:hypothetical protein
MKITIVLLNILFGCSAFAQSLNEVLECQKTVTSPVDDQYRPGDGYFVCDGPKKECFLAYKDGSVFRAKVDEHSTYTVNEINFDMADARQHIQHRLTTFVEPKSKKSAYVDIFWGENNRAFARNLLQANNNDLNTITFAEAKAKDLEKLAKKSVDDQLGLIQVMVGKKAGRESDLEKSKKSWLDRISACEWNKQAVKIKKQIADLK